MNCPRCGYVCSDLDTCCLRCRMMAAEGRSRRFVSPAEQTVVMSDLHGLLPEPPPRRTAGWLTVLVLTLILLIGLLAWHFTLTPHKSATPAPLTLSAEARPVSE